ncbi:MAG: FAD-dependent monooxygenase [candidate division Zixibacteria bacterium]|nr:FAD-dependent monooxygenase [candidate division Zixibacteria bacterium]
MTAALALRALGRPATVVEAGAQERIRPGSRAIFIHSASLMLLEKIHPGLGFELNSYGLTWRTKRTFYRGREIYHRTYPPIPDGVMPRATSLPQIVTERLLYRTCVEAGVEFIWNTPIVSASVSNNRVTLAAATGGSLTAQYVIAADGSRSPVRETAGLRLEGPQTTNAFVIVDTKEDTEQPLPVERVFHYEHPAVDGRNVLFVPFSGHWRVDLQCHPADDPEKFSGVDGARTWLPEVMPEEYASRITWVSTYIFRQAVANNFSDDSRRILLCGEAAHVFAPFGARGLNSGIPDAILAAGAIDCALKSASRSDALTAVDHFAASRRAAALRNRAASNTALRHLTSATITRRAVHRAAAAIAPVFSAAGRWMDSAPYGPVLGEPDADGMQY